MRYAQVQDLGRAKMWRSYNREIDDAYHFKKKLVFTMRSSLLFCVLST